MASEPIEIPNSPEGDELLDRAVTALRDMPIPLGPSAAVAERTRMALKEAARRELKAGQPRFSPVAIFSMAAAIAILCASAAVYRIAFHHPSHNIIVVNPQPNPKQTPVLPVAPHTPHIETPTPSPFVKAPTPVSPPEIVLAAGTITGLAIFDGIPPAPVRVSGVNLMPECQKAHGGPIYDESLVVNPDRSLANVVVSVSSGLSGWLPEFPPPSEPAVLNQRGCVFEPHVVAVMVGQPMLVKNSDPFLHNVRIMAVNNPIANLGQPTVGETATEPFESPEVFRVKCDVHPWMSAWVRVVDNPYFAVTGRDGRFTLRGLPSGTYTLKAWHEQLGVREVQITVGPARGQTVDFTFKPLQ